MSYSKLYLNCLKACIRTEDYVDAFQFGFKAGYFTSLCTSVFIYIFIRQKGSSNKWKKHQTHNNKNKQKREKTTLKSGGLVNSVTTNEL